MAGKGRALILGVGNILMRDEGLGVRAVEFIKRNFLLPAGVSAIDGGTLGAGLLSILTDFNHVILIDAVSTKGPPGTIRRLEGADLLGLPPLKRTAHGIGLQELIELARFEGLKAEFILIGAVPKDVSPGMELSPAMEKKLPEIAELAGKELKRLGYGAMKKIKNA